MKIAARLAAAAVLLALLAPEFPRYRAERALARAESALRLAFATNDTVEKARPGFERAAALAIEAMRGLPADPRPRMLAGSARLVAGRPLEALDFYRDAFATGERAEIDLNAGRAHALAGERPEAQAALLRAVWISPALAGAIPDPYGKRLLEEVSRLENDLRAGLLRTPPAMPE